MEKEEETGTKKADDGKPEEGSPRPPLDWSSGDVIVSEDDGEY